MKRLSTWCALILMLLASLPSAARSAASPSPLPPKTEINKGLPEQKAAPSQRSETETPATLTPINPTPASIVGSPASAEQERESNQQRPLPSITDWILAGVTSVYAVIAFFTLVAIKRQAKLAETAAIAAQQSADAAKRQTVTLTATLIATQQAADAAKTAAEAARIQAQAAMKTFQIAVRAKIEVHPTVALESSKDLTLDVYFEVLNQGETEAKIQFQTFNFFYKPRQQSYPPRFPDVPENSPQPLPQIFQPHDRAGAHIETVKLDGVIGDGQNREWDSYNAGQMLICFCAHIGFFAEGEIFHETFLCEGWDRAVKRFFVDPEMPRSWNSST